MGSELSFLIELLLNHDLPKATKDLVASRIKEVEQALTARPVHGTYVAPASYVPPGLKQAPSTLAAMARHGDTVFEAPVMPPVEPVAQIAQTAATAAALNSRNEAIAASLAGKVDRVSGRPRKW